MADFEIHLCLDGRTRRLGRARSNRTRGKETILFEYADEWLQAAERFALEPALPLTRGSFVPPPGQATFLQSPGELLVMGDHRPRPNQPIDNPTPHNPLNQPLP